MAYDEIQLAQVANPSPGVLLSPVLDLDLDYPERFTRDVNGEIQKRDIVYDGPTSLRILATKTSCSLTNWNTIVHWHDTQERLRIDDLAFSGGAGNPATDAYHYQLWGYISRIRGLSPQKIMLGEYESIELEFIIDEYSVITV